MPSRDGKGHIDRIVKYIHEQLGGDRWGYEEAIAKLRDHPLGYRCAFCIYFGDADITNGGFDQYFYNRFGCMTMSAIEGYERLGATRMVEIMKSALYVCLSKYPDYVERTNFSDVPDGYFDDFTPLANTFDDLDDLYWREAERLPGASEDVDSSYLIGPIDYYYDNFPEDFKPQ